MVTSKKPSPAEPSPEESGAQDSGTLPYPFADGQPLAQTQPLAPPLPPADPAVPSFLHRHPVAMGIIAAALAVVVLSGLTAWGVGAAVASSYEAAASVAAVPAVSAPPVASTKKGLAAGRTVVRGTIHVIEGSTWTITTRAGATQRVTVDSATLFGTKRVPGSASDFSVGSAVLIVEKASGEGKTAVRVVEAKAGAAKGGATGPVAPATPGT